MGGAEGVEIALARTVERTKTRRVPHFQDWNNGVSAGSWAPGFLLANRKELTLSHRMSAEYFHQPIGDDLFFAGLEHKGVHPQADLASPENDRRL